MPGDTEIEEEVVVEEELSDQQMDDVFAETAHKKEGVVEDLDDEGLPDPDEEVVDPPADEVIDPPAEDETDYYAGMDDATKAHFQGMEDHGKKLQHRIDSDNGRVNAYQVKAEESQRQLETLTAGSKEKPSEEEVAAALESGEALEAFREDYPEIAAGVDQLLADGFAKQDEKINGVLDPLAADKVKDDLDKSKTQMDTDNPGWRDKVATPEFATWLNEQPEAVRGLADSDATEDASDLVGLYDTHLRANSHSTDTEDSGDTTKDKRERQLEDGRTTESRSAGVNADSAGNADDPSNLFNHYAKKKAANG